jgi:hypothetical protein
MLGSGEVLIPKAGMFHRYNTTHGPFKDISCMRTCPMLLNGR